MKEEREATILNVDDNEAGRYATTRVLRKAGYRVVEAATGAEVLERLEAEPVDLVVLDINLPDANGLELCNRLKADARFARLPILHLTATYVMSMDRLQDSSADGYLMQPIEPAALVANIRALLRAAEAERRLQGALSEWQSALDTIEDAICVVGANREVIHTNASFEKHLAATLLEPPAADPGSDGPRRLRGLDDLLQQKSPGGAAWAEVPVEGDSYAAAVYPIRGARRARARQVIVFRRGAPA